MAAPSAETFHLEIVPDCGYAGGWRLSFIFADGERHHLAAPDEREARRRVQAYMLGDNGRLRGLTLVRPGEPLLDGGMEWEGMACGRSKR